MYHEALFVLDAASNTVLEASAATAKHKWYDGQVSVVEQSLLSHSA